MITLQKRLCESLLDDEDNLINNDEVVKEQLFYDECKKILPYIKEEDIIRNCKYNNNKISINSTAYISTANREITEYGDYIFKGFSISSNIEYIDDICIRKYKETKNFNVNKHSISVINKYPMNIKKIHWFSIFSNNILDYCKDINIEQVDNLSLYLGWESGNNMNAKSFDFFKCVKHINKFEFETLDSFLIGYKPIQKGVIKNINTDIMSMHIGNIIPGANRKTDYNRQTKDIFEEFVDDLFKNNNIKQFKLSIYDSRNKHKMYLVERGKSKIYKYDLKLI